MFTDSSKKTHRLSPLKHMQTKRCYQQKKFIFDFKLYVFINFVMITKQLNDDNTAVKMLILMRIKKLSGVIFPAVAVYL